MARAPLLRAYCAVSAVDVALAALGEHRARFLTKPALMPLLAAHVAGAEHPKGGKPLILAGLGLSSAGDVALLAEGERPFMVGLASFLSAHGCYLAAFLRRRGNAPRTRAHAKTLYFLAWFGLNAVLWPRTGPSRIPVVLYGSTLTAMAVAALDTGISAVSAGGAMFVLSDSILALDTFGVARLPRAGALVMLTYTTAQALIACGMVSPRRVAADSVEP